MSNMIGTTPWAEEAKGTPLPEKPCEARPWLVVHDPEGDFQGRTFRGIDLRQAGNWPPGTIFWNSQTGALRILRGGVYKAMLPLGKEKDAPQ